MILAFLSGSTIIIIIITIKQLPKEKTNKCKSFKEKKNKM